jgi:hypothetical protein
MKIYYHVDAKNYIHNTNLRILKENIIVYNLFKYYIHGLIDYIKNNSSEIPGNKNDLLVIMKT